MNLKEINILQYELSLTPSCWSARFDFIHLKMELLTQSEHTFHSPHLLPPPPPPNFPKSSLNLLSQQEILTFPALLDKKYSHLFKKNIA